MTVQITEARLSDERLREILADMGEGHPIDAHFAPRHLSVAELRALVTEVLAAREAIAEHDALFDLRWAADMRAIGIWRAANPGNDLVLPDSAELTEWLLTRMEQMREALKPFAAFAPYVAMFVEGRAKFDGSNVLPTKHFRKADFDRAAAALKETTNAA